MIFKFNEYLAVARTTATYPAEFGAAYVSLGLIGETGEVADKVKKLIRDDGWRPGQPVPENRRRAILLELGDVLWYVANYAYETNAQIADVFVNDEPVLRNPVALAVDMGENAQKPMRIQLVFLIKDVANMSLLLGSNIDQVAQMNADKLADRMARGVLTGSGDYR